jgi:hypothetical protein
VARLGSAYDIRETAGSAEFFAQISGTGYVAARVLRRAGNRFARIKYRGRLYGVYLSLGKATS